MLGFDTFPNRRLATVAGLTAAATLSMAGCSNWVPSTPETAPTVSAAPEVPEHVSACQPDQARELPTASNVTSVKDDRGENIYACHYFLDLKIPFNKPARINKITEKEVTTSSFTAEANIGGLVILGTGGVFGGGAANGKTETRDSYALNVEDTEGIEHTVIIPTDKVGKKYCENECKPSVTFNVPEKRLYKKKETTGWVRTDEGSIWQMPHGYYADVENRFATVSQVAITTANEVDSSQDGVKFSSISGGPAPIGQVVSGLANKITITLPASARG